MRSKIFFNGPSPLYSKGKSKNKTFSAGFTLIELLVVIAIIGVLSSVVLVAVRAATIRAHDARRMSDIKEMSDALELYYDSNGRYPAIEADSRDDPKWNTLVSALAPYIQVPKDPINGSGEGLMCGNCAEYYYYSYDGTYYHLATYVATKGTPTTGSNQYGPYYSKDINCNLLDFWRCN
jgi:prepilin-type N-terminal cleavage/methylation domain-containing protein